MKYLKFLLIPLLAGMYALLNRQRGTDRDKRFLSLPKAIIFLIFSLSYFFVGFYLQNHLIENIYHLPAFVNAGILFALMFFCNYVGFTPSWGECFPHSRLNTSGEKFPFPIKWLTSKTIGYEYNSSTDKRHEVRWKTVAMSYRWAVYFSLKYIILSAWFISFLPLLFLPLLLLVGPIYRFYFWQAELKEEELGRPLTPEEDKAVEQSEWTVGSFLGLTDGVLILCL